MQPFASSTDFSEALGVFVGQFTGQNPGTAKVVQAGVNVLSYGSGLAVNGLIPSFSTQLTAMSDAEARKLCEGVLEEINARSSAGAAIDWKSLPWAQLFQIAFTLLKKYLPGWVPMPDLPVPAPNPPIG